MGDMADRYSDYDADPEWEEPCEVTCKYCKSEHLEWEMTPAGWRLFEADGELHQCTDPFAVIKELECEPSKHTRKLLVKSKNRSAR
jgi:hypothetical protein